MNTAIAREALVLESVAVQRGGKEVLHGVSLEVLPGQITALVGANGAGKSSLVMAIAGELGLSSGSITLGGLRLHGLRPHAVRGHGVAVVPEGHRVLGDLSVWENLRVAALHLSRQEEAKAIEAVLDVFPELRAKLEDPGRSLSGGQKQMVCIAQALLAGPRFLVVDELSLGLAPAVVKRLADIVVDIAKKGVGVLLIEQFTTLALAMSSRAHVLVRGNVAWAGASSTLQENPEILHSSYLA